MKLNGPKPTVKLNKGPQERMSFLDFYDEDPNQFDEGVIVRHPDRLLIQSTEIIPELNLLQQKLASSL